MGIKDKDQIFIHTSATRPEWMQGRTVEAKRNEIRRWHVQDRGWVDIGYAVIIDRDGSIAYGRDLDKDGDFYEETAAAAKGYNKRGVHICLLGGHGGSANDKFSDHYTPAQERALRQEIEKIMLAVGKTMWVRGHNEVANKACPCFQVKEWWEKKPPRKMTESTTLQATGVGAVGTATTVISGVAALDSNAQVYVIIGGVLVLLALAWIARERIKAWGRGNH